MSQAKPFEQLCPFLGRIVAFVYGRSSVAIRRAFYRAAIFMCALTLSACSDRMVWKEEAKLHDGRTLIVERVMDFSGDQKK
jgi:hypothetical protein